MLLRLFVTTLVLAVTAVSIAAQTPAAPPLPQTPPTAMMWSFQSGGSYLGVETKDIDKNNYSTYGLRDVRGVAVEKVSDNSPAQAAGFAPGDVIVRFNGDEVTSARKLSRLVSEVAPDHAVTITVNRKGIEREVTATLAQRPTPKFENGTFQMASPDGFAPFAIAPNLGELAAPAMPAMPPAAAKGFFNSFGRSRMIGVALIRLSKQLAEHFGVNGGAMINSVNDNSPAQRAGLKAGDIIVGVEGKELVDDGDLMSALAEKKEGDVVLTIVRDGNRQTISVTPEKLKEDGLFRLGPQGVPGLDMLPPQSAPASPGAPAKPLIVNPRRIT